MFTVARLSRRGLLALLVVLEELPMTLARAELEAEVLWALELKPGFLDEPRERAS